MTSSGAVTQIRKGVLEYCVLALLWTAPRYGFQLVQALSQVEGMLTTEGTIYPLLSRLRKEQMVETEWQESASGPPRRYYQLTPHGEAALDAFRTEWITFRDAVDTILAGEVAQ